MSCHTNAHSHERSPSRRHDHGHSHGLVDESIKRSREGLRAVALALLVLAATAAAQALVFMASGSVALLADLIHNVGDAATAIPLAVAFALRSARAERWAGLAVVLAIFASASVAGWQAIDRLLHPQDVDALGALMMAGVLGFLGNWAAARIRSRAGRRLDSPALIADGAHARADAYVSLAVVLSAIVVALGLQAADPIIGLAVTAVILRITWHSFQTVRRGPTSTRSAAANPSEHLPAPIGYVHTTYHRSDDTPTQPTDSRGEIAELVVHHDFADGLQGLDGFDYAWLITWLDRGGAHTAPLTVVPHALRATGQHFGVFATRAPTRPNPIGLSLVRVLAIDCASVRFAGVDLLDHTPVLDIKPYSPDDDIPPSGATVRSGWMDQLGHSAADAGQRRSTTTPDHGPPPPEEPSQA